MSDLARNSLIDVGKPGPSGPANQPPWLLTPAMTTMALFLLAPFLILAAYSLLEPTGARSTGSWTLGNFVKLFLDPHYLSVIARTVWIALAVVSLTLVLGYALAFSIMSSAPRWRRLMLGLVVIPLLLSGVIRTFGWIVLLSRNGPLAGLLQSLGLLDGPLTLLGHPAGVIIGLTHVLMPFMVLAVASNLSYLDKRLDEAASGLGATPIRRFLRVTLPLTVPGIVTGSTLVFILAMGGFVTQSMLGFGRVQVLPILIYDQATTALNWPFAAAAAMTMLAVTLACLGVFRLAMRGPLQRSAMGPRK